MQVEAIVLISTWILEKYKAKRFSEGRAEGRAEERKKWAAWNQRREAAEAAGEKFNELPPLGEDVF